MRVIIILAAIALTHGAKLERTYLPPSNARTAGGSGNFLQTPFSGVSETSRTVQDSGRITYQDTGISVSGNDFIQSKNELSQSANVYTQFGNGLAQTEAQFNNVNYNFANEARPERPRAALERNAAILRQDSSNDGETFSYAYETENGISAEESGVATNGVEAQGGYSYTGDDGQVYSIRYTADQNGFVPQGDHLPTPPPVPEEILKALEQNARDEAAGIYDDGSYNEGKYNAVGNNFNNQYNNQQNNGYNGNDDDTVVTNSALFRSGNNGPTYDVGAPLSYGSSDVQNAPSLNALNKIAPIYGVPEQHSPALNAVNNIAPTYGTPANAPVFNSDRTRTTPTLNSASAIAPSYNTPNAASRTSATEKAYLPPLADQRARNGFGRRQQSFDARTGYKY